MHGHERSYGVGRSGRDRRARAPRSHGTPAADNGAERYFGDIGAPREQKALADYLRSRKIGGFIVQLIARYPQQIINIHHSLLPAFVGAKPRLQAYERGVKLIGATAHYVTKFSMTGPPLRKGCENLTPR